MDSVMNVEYSLSDEQILEFRRSGFIHLRDVLPASTIREYEESITNYVFENNPLQDKQLQDRSTYEQAFIQLVNVWRDSEEVKDLVFCQRLAQFATELLGVSGVRLYHDQALFKEPGGGLTPWHADQYYWPLSSNNTCTAWIPLQNTPPEMGPLSFSKRSHLYEGGRDLVISDESEDRLQIELAKCGFEHVTKGFDLGDVSFHYGWTYHRAGPNTSNSMRKVMTIIYMDELTRVAESSSPEHVADQRAFIPDRLPGELADTALNPRLYP